MSRYWNARKKPNPRRPWIAQLSFGAGTRREFVPLTGRMPKVETIDARNGLRADGTPLPSGAYEYAPHGTNGERVFFGVVDKTGVPRHVVPLSGLMECAEFVGASPAYVPPTPVPFVSAYDPPTASSDPDPTTPTVSPIESALRAFRDEIHVMRALARG